MVQLFAPQPGLALWWYRCLSLGCRSGDCDTHPTLKLRLDKLLVDRGLAASRERAQALIIAGKVLVNDQKLDKAGAQVALDAGLRLLGEDLKYVSRGGLKLEHALGHWQIHVEGKVCLDVGASTGGF